LDQQQTSIIIASKLEIPNPERFDGVSEPTLRTAVQLQYLLLQQAGLLFTSTDDVVLGESGIPSAVAQPLHLQRGQLLRLGDGYAEVFLGMGVVACLDVQSAIRMLDTRPSAPELALEAGSAMIELRDNKAARVRVRVGNSVTELQQQGVYEFDAGQRVLWVHAGRSETRFAGGLMAARDRESLRLESPGSRSSFGSPRDARLFEWCGNRSHDLNRAVGFTMTSWRTNQAWIEDHKVFGKRAPPRAKRPDPGTFDLGTITN
jgi:hypothetical protein